MLFVIVKIISNKQEQTQQLQGIALLGFLASPAISAACLNPLNAKTIPPLDKAANTMQIIRSKTSC